MALEGLRGFDYEEDITLARGTDAGVTDYLFDIPVGAVAGLSQAVKGLLQLGVMPIDYLANTDLLTGIDNIFDKITPETDTACLLYTSPSPRDRQKSRMPSSA